MSQHKSQSWRQIQVLHTGTISWWETAYLRLCGFPGHSAGCQISWFSTDFVGLKVLSGPITEKEGQCDSSSVKHLNDPLGAGCSTGHKSCHFYVSAWVQLHNPSTQENSFPQRLFLLLSLQMTTSTQDGWGNGERSTICIFSLWYK